MGNVVKGCMSTSVTLPPVPPQDVGPDDHPDAPPDDHPVAPPDDHPVTSPDDHPVAPQDDYPIVPVIFQDDYPVAPQDVAPTPSAADIEKWRQSRALSKLKKESSAFIVHRAVGHFTNTVMPLSQLRVIVPETIMHGCTKLYPDLMCETTSMHDICTIYEQHMLKPYNDRYPYSDSYRHPGPGRIELYHMEQSLSKMQSVTRFVELMRQYPKLPVFVKSDSAKMLPYGYLATTTLQPVHLAPDAQRHLWSIENRCSVLSDNRMLAFSERTDGLIPVLATVPIYEYAGSSLKGVMFVLPGAKIMWEQTNCCYETFLSDKVRNKCGIHFENLNSTIPLVIPSEPIVGGIVAKNCTQIELVIYGITVKLRHMSDPKPYTGIIY